MMVIDHLFFHRVVCLFLLLPERLVCIGFRQRFGLVLSFTLCQQACYLLLTDFHKEYLQGVKSFLFFVLFLAAHFFHQKDFLLLRLLSQRCACCSERYKFGLSSQLTDAKRAYLKHANTIDINWIRKIFLISFFSRIPRYKIFSQQWRMSLELMSLYVVKCDESKSML